MKIKNIDLVNLTNLFGSCSNKRLPQKLAYAIMKNMRILDKDLSIYREMLQKIFEAYKPYSEKDDKGEVKVNEQGIPIVDKDHEKAFYDEINSLLLLEIEVQFYTISEEVFDYDEGDRYDSLSVQDMINLQEVLCEAKE